MSPETSYEPSRVPGVDVTRAPIWLRGLFAVQRRIYGVVLEPTRVWARAPAALRGFVHLFAAVDRGASPLEPSLRSLVMVRVAQVASCAFCIDANAAILLGRGVSEDKVRALPQFRTAPSFSGRERAALALAEAMTRTEAVVDDALFAEVRAHFDEPETVELVALIAFQNASARFNSALRIPSQGLCSVPSAASPDSGP